LASTETLRERTCTPWSQVLEHLDHPVQADQVPLMHGLQVSVLQGFTSPID
jgi:hypothetical protein